METSVCRAVLSLMNRPPFYNFHWNKKKKIITRTDPSWPGLTFVTPVMRFYVDGWRKITAKGITLPCFAISKNNIWGLKKKKKSLEQNHTPRRKSKTHSCVIFTRSTWIVLVLYAQENNGLREECWCFDTRELVITSISCTTSYKVVEDMISIMEEMEISVMFQWNTTSQIGDHMSSTPVPQKEIAVVLRTADCCIKPHAAWQRAGLLKPKSLQHRLHYSH